MSLIMGALGSIGSAIGSAAGSIGSAIGSGASALGSALGIGEGAEAAITAGEVAKKGAGSGLGVRLGNVAMKLGPQLLQGSSAQAPQAPAFRPHFQAPKTQDFGSQVMSDIGQNDYNIKL